jgi:catechol 2,3-dioxygenase-like lactoylglutathione lyase family enzyme
LNEVVPEELAEVNLLKILSMKAESKTYGLTHLAIAVRDTEKTLAFYQHVFGMEVMYHEKEMIQLNTPGNHDILVFEQSNDAPIGQSGGIAHFGFRLKSPEDIEEISGRIVDAGGRIKEKGEFVPGSPYIFFEDPDGYTIEVWYEMLLDKK